jgi:uncharacterized membrane protein YccC
MPALVITRLRLADAPRRLGLALFRVHIENGVFVSLGMAAVGLGMALAFGRDVAILAATGALCTSIVDQPGPLAVKARMMGMAVAGATLLTILTILANGHALLMGLLVAGMSFVTGLMAAYGRRVIGLGVTSVLALLFGMAAGKLAAISMPAHVAIFAGGATLYSVFALTAAAMLDSRNRRMFLSEAVLAFSAYLDAKAELCDPEARARLALEALVEAHSDFNERLQAARDMIFSGRKTPSRLHWMAALLVLIDCFDSVVSGDADIETLRQSGHPDLLLRLKSLTTAFARDTEHLALTLSTPGLAFTFSPHTSEIGEIDAAVSRVAGEEGDPEPLYVSAFRSTSHKLALGIGRLERLAQAVDTRAEAKTILPNVELEAFVHRDRMDPRVLTSQLTFSSPIMRYAIRLTLAMTCGYLLTLTLPGMLHGGWVLLTTALIMRASYSITKQRRNDRILGTAAGCLVAALLVHFLPRDWLFLPVIVTVGTAHAFATVDFRVTALCASVTGLLQLHFLAPQMGPEFGVVMERFGDTLIGAGLAWMFSFLLPSWEWRNIPNLVDAKVAADRRYAALALARHRNDHEFRLARKRAHDSTANLSMTVRRLADEPRIDRRVLASLNNLVAANYMLASDLASMRVLFRNRAQELDPQATEQLLDTARTNVALTFDTHQNKEEPVARLSRRSLGKSLGGHNAMISLRRRLIHIEKSAERVAVIAANVIRDFHVLQRAGTKRRTPGIRIWRGARRL